MKFAFHAVCTRTVLVACFSLAASEQAESSRHDLESGGEPSPVEAQALTLLRTLRDREAAGPEVLGLQIHELGPRAIDCLLGILSDRRLADPLDAEATPQVLSEVQNEALLVALDAFGREAVMPRWQVYFGDVSEHPEQEAAVVAALHALEGFGLAGDLSLAWDLVGIRAEASSALTGPTSSALESAIEGILVRDPQAFVQLESSWSRLPDSWLDEIVRAVGKTRNPLGLGLFVEMLAMSGSQQRLIATQIPLLGPSDSSILNAAVATRMLDLAQSESKQDAQAAVLALAELEDFSVLKGLIAMLDDPRAGVPENTHRALCVLANNTLASSHALWLNWYKRELAWAKRGAPEVLDQLTSRNTNSALAALREVVRHRLNRHELAKSVTSALESRSESVRLMAARVLAELGSRWGARALVDSLQDESEEVRNAAHGSLVAILGVDRGPLFEDWQGFSFAQEAD